MSEDFKVMGFELTSNMEVELHTQEELEHLAKRHVINKQYLHYNQQLEHWLTEFRVPQEEGFKGRLKKYKKDLDKIGELNKVDRMAILNNKFANQAELLLKVPACQHVPAKDRKTILEGQIS